MEEPELVGGRKETNERDIAMRVDPHVTIIEASELLRTDSIAGPRDRSGDTFGRIEQKYPSPAVEARREGDLPARIDRDWLVLGGPQGVRCPGNRAHIVLLRNGDETRGGHPREHARQPRPASPLLGSEGHEARAARRGELELYSDVIRASAIGRAAHVDRVHVGLSDC